MSTTAVAPPTAAPPSAQKGTYLILHEKTVTGQDTAIVYLPVVSGIEASSAEQALKKWADNAPGGTVGGKYVALPCRSFKPTKVTFSTQTVVKLG